MSISKKNALAIYEQCQNSIRELNELLLNLKAEIEEEDFLSIRRSVAGAMGELVHVCELHVYKEYPEMRPYNLD